MSEREEWMNLIRNEYDPKPDLGRGAYPAFDDSWDDGAGRIADAILADKMLLERKHADDMAKRGWIDITKELPDLEDTVVCTDGEARWLDKRTTYLPDMKWQGRTPTHWHPIADLPSRSHSERLP